MMKINLLKLKGKRVESGKTRNQWAMCLEITEQALGNKLAGRTDFKVTELTKTFDFLGIKVEEIANFFTE